MTVGNVSLLGLIPGCLLALGAGSLRGAVGGWASWEQEPLNLTGAGLEAWLIICGHTCTPDACKSCMGVLFPAFLSHGTSGSSVGLGPLKNHQFLLGSGTRVGLQLESSHQLLKLQGIKSWGQAQKR